MDYKGMFIQYDMGMGVSRLPFYFVDGIDGKFKTEALAKRAITMHLNRKNSEFIVAPIGQQPAKVVDIEVVPRTQQEIDDYGPNGIQPPVRQGVSYLDEVISRFTPKMPTGLKVTESRNKREGGYSGHYGASDKNFKPAHWRQGNLRLEDGKRAFLSLKETSKANRYFASHGIKSK